jgi:hypothetical protein
MKKILFTGFTGIFLALLISIVANGQLALNKTQSSKNIASYVRSVTKDVPGAAYRNDINVRAVRHFLRNFNNVSNEEWYDAPDRFVVMFTLNNIDYRVDYDKKGNWIETFRTYDETKLPPDVSNIIKSSYYDYTIFQVQEIEMHLYPITYIIHLDGKTKLINLKVCNGEIEEWQNFNKPE